jgi:DNA-binding FadR family transcriptional regulator
MSPFFGFLSSLHGFLTMSKKTISRGPLFREIQLQIRNYIIENHLKPGDMLPPAAEIAAQLGVSSATLREAFRSLEALGVLRTKHGVGTFIRAYDLSPILDNLSFSLLFAHESLIKMVQIREAMEIGLIPAVVEQITEEDICDLETILAQMKDDNSKEGLEIVFHRTLYRCLNNALIPQFLDIFWLVHRDFLHRSMIVSADAINRWQIHAPIVDAIKTRDAANAVEAMRSHFDGIRNQSDLVQTHDKQPTSNQ